MDRPRNIFAQKSKHRVHSFGSPHFTTTKNDVMKIGLTDSPDMTSAVYHGRKAINKKLILTI